MGAGEAADRAVGWDRWGNWINRECDWSPVNDGTCLIGYHHYKIEDNADSGCFQNIDVEPGRYYTFSVLANADQPGDGYNGAKEVELRLETTLHGQQATIASKKYPAAFPIPIASPKFTANVSTISLVFPKSKL